MTNPVTPATDEEVEAMREAWSAEPVSWVNTEMMRLIARIDAERAEKDAVRDAYAEKSRHDAKLIDAERGQKEQAMRAFRAEAERQRLDDEQTALFIAKRAGWLDPTDHAALLTDLNKAEAERDAEQAALTESEAVRDRMRALLDAVAVAVRGPPAPNVLHDHARLPDEVAALVGRVGKAEADAQHLREESNSAFDAAATHLVRAERAEGLLREILDNDLPAVSAVYDPREHRVTEAWRCECGASASEVTDDFDDELIEHAAGCLRSRARAALSQEKGGR